MATNDPIDFGKYSTLFAGAVASFGGIVEKNFGSWSEAANELTGGLDQFTKFFSASKILIDLAILARSLEHTTVNLSRTFGSAKSESYGLVRNLQEISKSTSLFGKDFERISESYIAIRRELRTDASVNLTETAAKMSQIFTMSDEAAGHLTASLARFAKVDGKTIESMMGSLAQNAEAMHYSVSEVGKNLSDDLEVMTRFGALIRKNRDEFAKQAAITYSIGSNLKQAVTLADQLRTPGGAGEMAAKLSMLGIRVNPMALFAQGFGGNPAELQNRLFGATYRKAQALGGPDSNAARSLAMQLGPLLGQDTDSMINIWKRLEERELLSTTRELTTVEWQKKMLAATNTNGQTLENSYKALVLQIGTPLISLLALATPIAKGLNTLLGMSMHGANIAGKWVGGVFGGGDKAQSKTGEITSQIVGALVPILGLLATRSIAMKLWQATGSMPKQGPGAMWQKHWYDIFRRRKFGGSTGESLGRSTGRGGGLSGGLGEGEGTLQTLTAPQMIARMGGAALVMVAFAGSIWILSKAFQNFAKVDWKAAGIGGATMVTFATMSFIMAKGISALGATLTNPMFLAGIAVMGVLAAAVWGVSVAFKNFGEGIKIGAEGFQILGSLDIKTVRNTLDTIGEWADLYSPSLDSASRSVERIAKAIGKLSDNVAGLDIAKTRELFAAMNPMPTLAGVGANGYSRPIVIENRMKYDGILGTRSNSKVIDVNKGGK